MMTKSINRPAAVTSPDILLLGRHVRVLDAHPGTNEDAVSLAPGADTDKVSGGDDSARDLRRDVVQNVCPLVYYLQDL